MPGLKQMSKADEKLFILFNEYRDNYFGLFLAVSKLIEEEVRKAKGEENRDFYTVLSKLSNSINNAGWQDRHSQQINLINETQESIITNYEDFLP